MDEPNYVPEEAALLLKRKRETIYRYVKNGKLGYRRSGRKILIPASEVERFLGQYVPPVESTC